jgi:hypothetical protein
MRKGQAQKHPSLESSEDVLNFQGEYQESTRNNERAGTPLCPCGHSKFMSLIFKTEL